MHKLTPIHIWNYATNLLLMAFMIVLLAFQFSPPVIAFSLEEPLEVTSTEIPIIMPYSTNTDLFDRMDEQLVIDLTDDAQTGEIDQTKVDNLRADCTELIHTYLRGRHTVPLDPAPDILVNIEADLLVHKVYTRRANYEIPDSVKELKKDALKHLQLISEGKIVLQDQPDAGEAKIVSNKSDTSRIFTDDILNSF